MRTKNLKTVIIRRTILFLLSGCKNEQQKPHNTQSLSTDKQGSGRIPLGSVGQAHYKTSATQKHIFPLLCSSSSLKELMFIILAYFMKINRKLPPSLKICCVSFQVLVRHLKNFLRKVSETLHLLDQYVQLETSISVSLCNQVSKLSKIWVKIKQILQYIRIFIS